MVFRGRGGTHPQRNIYPTREPLCKVITKVAWKIVYIFIFKSRRKGEWIIDVLRVNEPYAIATFMWYFSWKLRVRHKKNGCECIVQHVGDILSVPWIWHFWRADNFFKFNSGEYLNAGLSIKFRIGYSCGHTEKIFHIQGLVQND